MTCSKDELHKIAEADDLHISPLRGGGVTYGTRHGSGQSRSTTLSTCAVTTAKLSLVPGRGTAKGRPDHSCRHHEGGHLRVG